MSKIYSIDGGKLYEHNLHSIEPNNCFTAKHAVDKKVFRSSFGNWYFKDKEECIKAAFEDAHAEIQSMQAEIRASQLELNKIIEATPKTLEEFRATI